MAIAGTAAGAATGLLNRSTNEYGGGGSGWGKVLNPFIKKGLSGKQRVQRIFDPFSLFGSDDPIEPRPDYPYMAAENLYNWAQDYGSRYDYDPAAPYQGQLTAPLGGTERQAQGRLSDYVGQGTASSLNQANKYNTDVLQGGYDPRKSPYYASMKEQIMKDAGEAKAAIMHDSARSGLLHSDPRREQERRLTETTSGQMANLIGNMYESERGRMGTAASQAPQIAQSMSSIPLQKISAGATVGAIPRQVNQEGLDRNLTEYKRQVAGAREPLNIYQSLSGQDYNPYPAQPYYPGQSSSGSSGSSGMMSQLIPLLMSMISK